MNKITEIRSIEDLKEYIYLNKESIKRAALPIGVLAALLFFWLWNGGEDTSIQSVVDEGDGTSQVAASSSHTEDGLIDDDGNHDAEKEDISIPIYVDISGCINNPGVYEVEEGTRVFQLIERAGGLTQSADIEDINRAEEVYDGQKLVIASLEEGGYGNEGASGSSYRDSSQGDMTDSRGRININRASSGELQNIPGVGPATAEKIIEYRENNGFFKSIEDIKKVSGIGDKTFESMKEYITV